MTISVRCPKCGHGYQLRDELAGKQAKCLRGAMGAGGVVCQDCHGDMKQVGNDFTAGFPSGTGADLAKRVPWAMEPKCQSCHVGDAKSVATMNRAEHIVAPDGIRNLLAFTKSSAAAAATRCCAKSKAGLRRRRRCATCWPCWTRPRATTRSRTPC